MDNIKEFITDYSPIIVFAYNRVYQLSECIKALENNEGVDQSVLYVFADQAVDKNNKGVAEVREYLREYSKRSKFKNLQIIETETHKGLAKSVIDGVTGIIDIYDEVIVVEDDVIVSSDFIQFMNEGLKFYKANKTIWSITGVGYDLKALKHYKPYVYLAYRGGSECWATWKDRWDLIDWGMDYYDSFRKNMVKRIAFNRGGNDLSRLLKYQYQGKIDSWAIRWDYAQFENGMMTITPRKSFMYNIGYDGNGTHCTDYDPLRHRMKNVVNDYHFEDVEPNKIILRDYRAFFSTGILSKALDKWRCYVHNKNIH